MEKIDFQIPDTNLWWYLVIQVFVLKSGCAVSLLFGGPHNTHGGKGYKRVTTRVT